MFTSTNTGNVRRNPVLAAALLAMAFSGRSVAQEVTTAPARPPIVLQVLDERGEPLAAGTELFGTLVRFHPAICDNASGPFPIVVGAAGSVSYTPAPNFLGFSEWLRLARPTARGARVLVPLSAPPERVALVAEERLAAGALVDETGTPLPQWAAGLRLEGTGRDRMPAFWLIEPRWVRSHGKYELWGWRAEGSFWINAFHAHHGPSAPREPLAFGRTDLDLTLPATGCVQVHLKVPEPFPERAAYAVLRDLDRGGVRRHFLLRNDATNIRTLVGRFAVTLELNGVVVRDCGELTVAHGATTEVRHDLRRSVRVFRIEVVDEEGNPIPAARVDVVGSRNEPMGRQPVEVDGVRRFAFVVATTAERVDLEVSDFGSAPIVVEDVDGDRTIELPRRPR